jgi:hypothetical protein
MVKPMQPKVKRAGASTDASVWHWDGQYWSGGG